MSHIILLFHLGIADSYLVLLLVRRKCFIVSVIPLNLKREYI